MRWLFFRLGEWWTVNIVHTLLEADRCLMLDNLFHKLLAEYSYITCSCTTIHVILRDQLEMRKVRARSVPQQLVETGLDQCRKAAFLTEFNKSGKPHHHSHTIVNALVLPHVKKKKCSYFLDDPRIQSFLNIF